MSNVGRDRWRRLRIALVAMAALASMQLSALPIEALWPPQPVCTMMCSLEGGPCCCMLAGLGHDDPDGHQAAHRESAALTRVSRPCGDAAATAGAGFLERAPSHLARGDAAVPPPVPRATLAPPRAGAAACADGRSSARPRAPPTLPPR